MSKEPKYLYEKIKDKYLKYPFTKEEELRYREICMDIWGGVPCDVNWAINTNLYKNKKSHN